MKLLQAAVLTAFLVPGLAFAAKPVKLDNEDDRTNYSIGYKLGGDFKRQGVNVRKDALLKGIEDAAKGREPQMSIEEMQKTMSELSRRVVAAQQQQRQQQGAENMKQGEAFLAQNAKKKGVTTLPSGLQYKVIKKGSGKKPTKNDTVTVHYRGTLIDGTEFDSSHKRGEPATFGVGQVIPGWTEALQLMPEGSQWQLFIPSKLGYGARGAGNRIGPNSTLIFDVELISIK